MRIKALLGFRASGNLPDAEREAERYRHAALAMIANIASRGVAMIVMILSVSLTLPYLGEERFGVWMTIASFVVMLSFLDLGVGNALANRVAEVAATSSKKDLPRTISGGLGFLFLIGMSFSLILWTMNEVFSFYKFIKLADAKNMFEVKRSFQIFFFLFGVSVFSNGLQRVFAGLQQSYYSHVVGLVGSLLSLFVLWLTTQEKAGIPILLTATLGVQLLSNLGLLYFLNKRKLVCFEKIISNTIAESKQLYAPGALFFALQVGTMVGWGADNFIIAATLGAGQVAIYSVTQKLFQFISQPLAIMNAPLWGAYADAHARGEKSFIRKTFKRSVFITFLVSIVVGALILTLGDKIIEIWSKDTLDVPRQFLLIFFLWTILETTGNSFAMMANGCRLISKQVASVTIFVFLTIPLKLITAKYGLEYVVMSTIVAYVIAVPFFYIIFARKEIKGLYS